MKPSDTDGRTIQKGIITEGLGLFAVAFICSIKNTTDNVHRGNVRTNNVVVLEVEATEGFRIRKGRLDWEANVETMNIRQRNVRTDKAVIFIMDKDEKVVVTDDDGFQNFVAKVIVAVIWDGDIHYNVDNNVLLVDYWIDFRIVPYKMDLDIQVSNCINWKVKVKAGNTNNGERTSLIFDVVCIGRIVLGQAIVLADWMENIVLHVLRTIIGFVHEERKDF